MKTQRIVNGNFAEIAAETKAYNTSRSLAEQLLLLLTPVYRGEKDDSGRSSHDNNLKPLEIRLEEASKLSIRWDSKSHQYTFLDGKTIPEPKRAP